MSLAGVKCLVTGAGGFLGQRIVHQLLEDEDKLAEIRALDKAFSPEALQKYGKLKSKTTLLTMLQGDIRDVAFIQTALQGVSLVIHTASLIDVVGKIDKQILRDVNVKGTQLLLETCIRNDVQYFIYTSTLEVAGPNRRGDPVYNGNEDTPYLKTTEDTYSETKKEAERAVLKADGLPLKGGMTLVTCALRPMYIFGEGSPFLLIHLDECILNKNVFRRISRKEALVNPVYVGNVSWAHVLVAKAMRDPEKVKRVRGNVYFISDDTPHVSYADLNHELGKDLGLGVEAKLAMPLTLLYFYALLLEIISFLLRPFVRYVPIVTRHLLTLLNTPFSFSYQKASRDFGYMPRYKWVEAKHHTSQWIAEMIPLRTEYLKNKRN